jgi:hypothetical protein
MQQIWTQTQNCPIAMNMEMRMMAQSLKPEAKEKITLVWNKLLVVVHYGSAL